MKITATTVATLATIGLGALALAGQADTPKAPQTAPAQANTAPKLLEPGTIAPDFEAVRLNGSKVKLSDYKGSVVILDFWSTWCGPCQASMPHTQAVYEATKDQGVKVLGVCEWDDKAAFDKWVPENKQYTFDFAYDTTTANVRPRKGICSTSYNVVGIPTMYLIGKDGKVIKSIVGYMKDSHELEKTLRAAGVNVADIGG